MMRISADQGSPFWWALNFTNPEIYLDGQVVHHVVEADEAAGIVTVVDYDEGGRPRHAGGCFLTKTLTGKVQIKELGV